MDQTRLAVRLELLAQVADVHAQRVAGDADVVAPDAVVDQLDAQHAARVEHEQLEQLVLGAGQLDRAPVHARGVGVSVELERAELQRAAVSLRQVAADDRRQTRAQLADVVGLDEVVVGAGLQPDDPILDRIPGGEHQHRGAVARAAQPAADLDAVDLREADVEDHDVGHVLGQFEQAVLTVRAFDHLIAGQQQRSPDRGAHRIVILDYKNSHLLPIYTADSDGNSAVATDSPSSSSSRAWYPAPVTASSPALPAATRPVANASASTRSGPQTVAEATPAAGRPATTSQT